PRAYLLRPLVRVGPRRGRRATLLPYTALFRSIPMGHEFTSLVLALLQVGGHPAKITEELADQVRNLEGDYRFETFMSLSCQSCPDRKSTRLNSSHVKISYAVFCLNKQTTPGST